MGERCGRRDLEATSTQRAMPPKLRRGLRTDPFKVELPLDRQHGHTISLTELFVICARCVGATTVWSSRPSVRVERRDS